MEPNEIKAFRKARNQSQSAFGADLGVDRKTVQRWEHGETRPPGRLLDMACKHLERVVPLPGPEPLKRLIGRVEVV